LGHEKAVNGDFYIVIHLKDIYLVVFFRL